MHGHAAFFRSVRRSRCGRIGLVLFWGCWLNMLACSIIASILGGDALHGIIEGDQYFLTDHGRRTQVEPWVFWYSRAHHISMFVGLPFALLGWIMIAIGGNLGDDDEETGPADRGGSVNGPQKNAR